MIYNIYIYEVSEYLSKSFMQHPWLGPHDIVRFRKHSAVVTVGYFKDDKHSAKMDALTDKGLG